MNTIGIWINLLCRMWEMKEEGVLRGTSEELALLVGAKPEEFKRFLKEAKERKFCDVVTKMLHDVTKSYSVVTIKCRRMNKVFNEREGAKRRMQKHRRKQDYVDVTFPSSSSSSSSILYTLQEVKNSAFIVGLTEQQATKYFHHYNSQGWLKANGRPITNLVSAITEWRNNQYKFVEKKDGRTDKISGGNKPFIR